MEHTDDGFPLVETNGIADEHNLLPPPPPQEIFAVKPGKHFYIKGNSACKTTKTRARTSGARMRQASTDT